MTFLVYFFEGARGLESKDASYESAILKQQLCRIMKNHET